MSTSDLPPVRKWDDVRSPIGAVHIIHGLAEHPERYDELARALNQARFIVWAHHHRGHGKNPVPGIRGHFADQGGWHALIDDAWAVSKQLLDEWRLPLVMFAHSMGSFVGQGVLADHGASYRAAVFSGTNGPPAFGERRMRDIARVQVVVLQPRNPGVWLQKIVIEDTYNAKFGPHAPPNTWLSRDEEEVGKYTVRSRLRISADVTSLARSARWPGCAGHRGILQEVPARAANPRHRRDGRPRW